MVKTENGSNVKEAFKNRKKWMRVCGTKMACQLKDAMKKILQIKLSDSVFIAYSC
jgi:hypothetical protein